METSKIQEKLITILHLSDTSNAKESAKQIKRAHALLKRHKRSWEEFLLGRPGEKTIGGEVKEAKEAKPQVVAAITTVPSVAPVPSPNLKTLVANAKRPKLTREQKEAEWLAQWNKYTEDEKQTALDTACDVAGEGFQNTAQDIRDKYAIFLQLTPKQAIFIMRTVEFNTSH